MFTQMRTARIIEKPSIQPSLPSQWSRATYLYPRYRWWFQAPGTRYQRSSTRSWSTPWTHPKRAPNKKPSSLEPGSWCHIPPNARRSQPLPSSDPTVFLVLYTDVPFPYRNARPLSNHWCLQTSLGRTCRDSRTANRTKPLCFVDQDIPVHLRCTWTCSRQLASSSASHIQDSL